MMVLFWTIAVFALFQRCDSQDPRNFDFMYKCRQLSNGQWEMFAIIDPHGNDVKEIFAVDPDTEISIGNNCSSNPVAEITNSGNKYYLTVSIDSSTEIASPACGVQTSPDGGLQQGQFRWKFEVVTDFIHPAFRLAYEKYYVVFCDFNDDTLTESEFLVASVNVSQIAPPDPVVPNDPGKISVVLADSLTVVSAISSNDVLRLKAELVTENLAPGTPTYTGVSPYDCKACDSIECNTFIPLTSFEGCTLTLGVNPTLGGEPFTNATSMSTEGAVLFTGSFEPFAFSDSLNTDVTNLVFQCTFDYCNATSGPAKCADRCATLGSSRRKRRDVQTTESVISSDGNKTNELDSHISVLVKIVSNVVRGDINPVTGEFPSSKPYQTQPLTRDDRDQCDGYLGFLIGVCILGVSLLISLAVCLCLCVKIFSHRRNAERLEIKSKSSKNFH